MALLFCKEIGSLLRNVYRALRGARTHGQRLALKHGRPKSKRAGKGREGMEGRG